MKIQQEYHYNPKKQRRLQAVLFALILIGTVFVSIVGNVGAPVFEPPHSDYGEDTDDNSLFNYLVVNVIVNVTTPGNYIIDGSLTDSFMTVINSDVNSTFLNAGIQVVQLRFEGWLIRANGVNAPYTVYLDLYDGSWNLLDTDVYTTTNPYKDTDFELPPAAFSPPYSDYGLDTDGDGYFNYLVVNVTIDVSVAGNYEVEGVLFDSIPNWIDATSNFTFLSVGIQVVQLYFDGMSIYRNGVNGTYTVNLQLNDNSSNMVDTDTYTTNIYTYNQFQAPGASFKPPHSDYGLDTDSDGYFNFLVVNITVEVSVAGFYRIEGDLLNDTPKWIDDDANDTFLNVGTHVVQLRFSGVSIYIKELNGPYIVELDAFDDLASWLDSDNYLTNFYTYDQFQPPQVVLQPPYSDYGLDTDGDGFFNYLVVNITVNVGAAGDYRVTGSLFDSLFEFIEFIDNSTFLDPGIQVVQLYFSGSVIYNHGVSGSYLVFLELFDSLSNSLDSDIHATGSYTFDQFQPPDIPPPPTGLKASLINGGNDVMLSWNASADDGKGENDVAGYTVYKSITGIEGIYNFAAWIIAIGSLSYNWIDVNAGDGDWNDYFYIVRANDTLDIEEQNTNKVGKIVSDLQDGWNLISVPLIQIDTSKEYVLQTLDSNYASLQRYRAGKSRPWLHWHRGKPSHLNDPMDFHHKEGYYIDMLTSDHLVVVGKVPSNTQISLKTGWNLMSYPSLINRTVSDALSSIAGKYNVVYCYDTVIDREIKLTNGDYMQPELGYWIHATENCVWDI
jgi:hypothetical protein